MTVAIPLERDADVKETAGDGRQIYARNKDGNGREGVEAREREAERVQ